jgi:hypothetical protein
MASSLENNQAEIRHGGRRPGSGRKHLLRLVVDPVKIEGSLTDAVRLHAGEAMACLVNVIRDPEANAGAKVNAAKEILRLAGEAKDGAGVATKPASDLEIARWIIFMLESAKRKLAAEQLTKDAAD